MSVYFIQEENNGLIKIGYSDNPKDRLRSLQVSSPNKLKIIKVVDGNFDRERFIHYKFSKFSVRGEWFSPNSELVEYINNLEDSYSPKNCKIKSLSWRIPKQVLEHAKKVSDELGYKSYQHLIADCFIDKYPMSKDK